MGWAGMRGTVTLAGAMSIPYLMPDGRPFPGRDIVVFLAFARLLESVAFEVKTVDAATLAGALATVLAISSLAAWMPARRAARVDPAEALRAD